MENAAALSIDLNAVENVLTGFHYAYKRGHLDVVKIFMENAPFLSLDLNGKDSFDFTGYLRTCKRGYSDIVKVLIWRMLHCQCN